MIVINPLDQKFGRNALDRQNEMNNPDLEGALAAIETFYYSFNQADLEVMKKVWASEDLIRLKNPVGGVTQGIHNILSLYEKVFGSGAKVWVELSQIIFYSSKDMAIFSGFENGEYRRQVETESIALQLKIRTTRIFAFNHAIGKWGQVHHHGSIDDPLLLADYQRAVFQRTSIKE